MCSSWLLHLQVSSSLLTLQKHNTSSLFGGGIIPGIWAQIKLIWAQHILHYTWWNQTPTQFN